MSQPPFTTLVIASVLASLLLATPQEASAILGFGKKKSVPVLSPEEAAQSEAAAAQELAAVKAKEGQTSASKLRGMYAKIVKNHPGTSAAGEAQFRVAELRVSKGSYKRGFDEFQAYVDDYKKEPQFDAAVASQYDVAVKMLNSDEKKLLFFDKVQPTELVEMFQQITLNAPYSEFAPRALYNVGIVYQKSGDVGGAIDAFDSVFQDYPNSKEAAEAQYQKFLLMGANAAQSENPANIRQQREVGQDFLNQFEGDPRAADVRSSLGQLEDKESEKNFNIGRFYEKQGQLRSAAVYYREVMAMPGSERYEDAKARLERIAQIDPSVKTSPRRAPKPVPAEIDTKERLDYLGPKLPEVESERPKMRTSEDDVLPIPPTP